MTDIETSTEIESQYQGGSLPQYLSPIIQILPAALRPTPSTVCETCPQSRWFTTSGSPKDELKCFCKEMNAITWNPGAAAINRCDGRELSLLMMKMRQERREQRAAEKEAKEIEKQQRALERFERAAAKEAERQEKAAAKANE